MTPELFGVLERVHGHIAVLGLAVLLHPVITVRRRRGLTRWMKLSAELGAGLLLTSTVLGWVLYPVYRAHVKLDLFAAESSALWRFESKEHLAFMAAALALGGAISLRCAGRTPEGRRAAWSLLAAAWACGVATGVLGIYVAGLAQPGW